MNRKINRLDLISLIADKSGLTKRDTGIFIDAFADVVMSELANGSKIHIMGFGDFEMRERAERNGVNPRTGEKIVIPKTYFPTFKASVVFKNAVSKECK